MKTKTIINTLKYWEDISDCVCDNTTPIGGCLKCDMKKCIDDIIAMDKNTTEREQNPKNPEKINK